ncbi:MAG: TPR end-of-group domain-containing protein [Gaiellaceae bacterium]
MNATTISELTRENGWAPIRAHLGARAFGINAYTKNTGEQIVGEHKEEASGHEELYLVVAGRATFTVDGEERDAPVGTAVLVPSGTSRSADAAEDGTTIVVVGGRPGAVFQPRAWETNAVICPRFGEGRIDEARDILRGVVDQYEDGESIEYNLACCEARLGDVESAFEHLDRALVGRPDLVELARGDDDLAALRGDPRFDELVGAAATPPG